MEYAKSNGFVIATNDADFEELSVLYGAPPHVVWLKGSNVSKPGILTLLMTHAAAIQDTIETEGRACVEIVKRIQ